MKSLTTLAALCIFTSVCHASGRVILTNGELDQWQGDQLVGWNVLEGAVAKRDTTMRVSGISSVRMYPTRDQKAAHNHVILEQMVELQPNSTYRLTFWTAKDGMGDARAYVVAQDGSGIVLEYITGWAHFFVWTPITCTFETNDATRYAVRLAQYGYPNRPVWFDRVKLERVLKPGEQAKPSLAKVNFFSQSPMIPFDESSPDHTTIHTDQFTLQKAGNEYEATLVAIQAGDDLSKVDLRLSGDLISRDGENIPAQLVELRSYEAGVLPLTRPREATKNQCLAWWVTVKPTPDLAPGLYSGKLEIVSDGRPIGTATLVVEQMDITLPDPDASFFTWHSNYYFPSEYVTPELMKAYYKDMAEHGMTTVTIYNTATPDGKTVDFSRNHMLSAERYANFSEFGYDDTVPAILEAGLCKQDQPLLLLYAAQEGPAVDKSLEEPVAQEILEKWQANNWPKPYFYVSDEPSNQERIDKVKPVLEKIKKYSFPVDTTTAGLDIPQLGHLYDLWIQAESEINWEHLEAAREHGATLWAYNCTVPYTNAPFNRAFYGFWAYRTGLKGFGRWAYHDERKAIVDADGVIHGTTGAQLSFVFASADGPVPTVGWEAAREGVDDYRLMMLFDQIHEDAKYQLTLLEKQYEGVLSEEDIKTITQIEERQFKRKTEDETPIEWKASSSDQSLAAEALRKAIALKELLLMTKYARTKAFESIPADAMGHRGALPFASANKTLYPPLGLGDQRTIAEIKRRTLMSYMLRLREAIE